ncbi:MAG: hypothetical protein EPO57_07500 [Chitinophagaceae bacterium]|nr:MAG: hypothetical protein EPO57_07500 [Chitinophagaceae bacterium]
MKKSFYSILIFLLFTSQLIAQNSNSKELQQTAREFMKAGDWDNAILVFSRAIDSNKFDLQLQKDLLQCYYYKRDFENALPLIKAIIDNPNADVPVFQIAGNVYYALGDVKEGEKLYKTGIKKFPKSGPLYSEYGTLLNEKKDPTAIDFWEKGIETDPGYSGNYYNAARYYFSTKNSVWAFLYGEIFVNMESLSERGSAIKELLLAGYKQKFFLEIDLLRMQGKNKNEFIDAFLESMAKQSSIITKGVTVETLAMIRSRFILDWFSTHAEKFPFRLFDYQQQLLKEGLFDAYNQWLFGITENLAAYDKWTKVYSDEHNRFTQFMKNRVFKVPQGQYYQNK